ncbi:ATP-dependent helicase [Reticulomyxa filosa]|uniref:ATP-dependent helicase n=1 Tax=Reticulomyxa filosa TaxID=46433 RepID=X6MIB1_RETFI|nr:ATP-dependent helicase [Reticulomyxa filosa]|eukprot:ETO12800.1 ATP-dependent helicase [Reticulomyxa filosa]
MKLQKKKKKPRKTHVAVAIVEEFFRRNPKGRVLICSYSNVAVDVLCRRIADRGMQCLRLGYQSDLEEQGYGHLLLRNQSSYRDAMKTPIIACTCIGSKSSLKHRFDLVLIDETSQCSEIGILPPLQKLKDGGSLVLIGDHQQLPPTVLSFIAKQRGLQTSLFERLIKNGRKAEFLDIQYRMHASLSEFPSRQFYDGRLKTADNLERHIPRGFPWPVADYPVCFVHVESEEVRNAMQSVENEKEADLVVKIAQQIWEENRDTWIANAVKNPASKVNNSITIITPYRGQKAKIEQKLILNRLQIEPKIDVCTVDGFQGNESEVIIFSAVRSNLWQNIGFVRDQPRINVMLTRARCGLIVIGNMDTLISQVLWRKWLRNVAVERGSIIDSRVLTF